jgi:soluble lytic murein transglycosylase-like protein
MWLAIILTVSMAAAQSPADMESRVRASMAGSLEKQRASVQRQVGSALPVAAAPPANASGDAGVGTVAVVKPVAPVSAGFFTTPWAPMTAARPVQAACDPLAAESLNPLVDDAAKREGVGSELVHAVIDRESGARPCAVSPKGAQGLMQLMPSVASDFGVQDPFDPKQNVSAGTRLLKQLLTKYNGDVGLALGAYNAGSGRVDREGGIPDIPETINYVSDILAKVAGK